MTLVEFLLARIAEDEEWARAATPGPWEARESGYDDDTGSVSTVASGFRPDPEWGDAARSVALETARGYVLLVDAVHIARHDPARVLAECAAKRAIVELHRDGHECSGFYGEGLINGAAGWFIADDRACDTLLLLAQPYVDHPDFDPAWRLTPAPAAH